MAPAGETLACKPMAPLNAFRLVKVIVDEFDEPDSTVSDG